MVPTMFGSRDGERMLLLNSGILMEFQRPLRTTTGSHIHLISSQTVVHPISDALLPTQDGGNSSDTKVPQL
jgi:hypothetical protein